MDITNITWYTSEKERLVEPGRVEKTSKQHPRQISREEWKGIGEGSSETSVPGNHVGKETNSNPCE